MPTESESVISTTPSRNESISAFYGRSLSPLLSHRETVHDREREGGPLKALPLLRGALLYPFLINMAARAGLNESFDQIKSGNFIMDHATSKQTTAIAPLAEGSTNLIK